MFTHDHPHYIEACKRIDAAIDPNDETNGDGLNQLVASLVARIDQLELVNEGLRNLLEKLEL